MQILQAPSHRIFFFSFPKTLNPTTSKPYSHHHHHLPRRPLLSLTPTFPRNFIANSFSSDEFPVDETFLENFGPKDKETEDEARIRNWVERGWAPWEEILSPEADFARKSLNEGEEVPLQSPEAIEAFKMLRPSYRKKKMEEMGLSEDDYYRKQFELKGEIPEPLKTVWAGPLVVRHLPPRDWPPRGWEVDKKELEFIREAHKLQAVRVPLEGLESEVRTETDDMCLDRYKVFLKQYKEWVAANKDRLEEESYKYDLDYHPGRRKRGKDYKEGMYELPFYYPGQAKRDPYRFRFPIEMRFVFPNIDHLIFNRFEFPPIFHRDEDTNPDELRRDCGRPPVPRKNPGDNPVEEALLSNHPYVEKLWQIHVAEQMILDDLDANPDKYKGKKLSELTDEEEFDEENSVEYTKAYYKKSLISKVILKTSVKELDLEAAFAEREVSFCHDILMYLYKDYSFNMDKPFFYLILLFGSFVKQHRKRLIIEAKERGEEYKITKMRRNDEMDEYDFLHWRRSFEEREALIRDISCRRALGLPLEEPRKFVDASYFGKDQYDPTNPLYRYDYWGEPKNSEKSKQERMMDAHNKSIVGKGKVWYETSYEDCIEQKMQREAKGIMPRTVDDEELNTVQDDDDDDDDDIDFSILGESNVDFSNQPHVNGTESLRLSDDGMFED
ncbi:protein PLASTID TRANSCRIPTIONALLY ACTIVE 10 isoform X3 [Ziziphus jujuba]|uniref:Protein PLASTID TRANSCRIPTIONALLY ACTIVE 10 isoform X3 n=1 Tax=Ziziphus jujuba TaxID=326968 RepID=A0ABM3IJK4_ZIZJJ|nr:protein PLASTID TRANSCRIPTIONALLY ACTIVE 10 isoform X3 [Ziziphus jujuba]